MSGVVHAGLVAAVLAASAPTLQGEHGSEHWAEPEENGEVFGQLLL